MQFQNNLSKRKRRLIILLALLASILVFVAVVGLNLSWRPDISQLPPDSGFYAYVGKAITEGKLLYVDLWDDKPPLGYYLNALALIIFGKNPWGVWWSSVSWIAGCTLLLFAVISKIFGKIPGFVSSGIFLLALMNPELFQGGNLMEIYSLAVQIAIIGIAYIFFSGRRNAWLSMMIGGLSACAYLIKPPTIVLGCSSIFVMVACTIINGKLKEVLKLLLGFMVGSIVPVLLVTQYWVLKGAFGALLSGALLQGFSFIGGSESRIREYFFYTLIKVLPKLYLGNLFLISLLGGGIFLLSKYFTHWVKPILRKGFTWYEWTLVVALSIFPLGAPYLWPDTYIGKFWAISIFCLGIFFLVKFYRLKEKPLFHQVFSPPEWTWLIGLVGLPFEVLMASLGGRYFGHYFITMIPALALTIALPVWKLSTISKESLRSKNHMISSSLYILLVISILTWGINSFIADLPSSVFRRDIAGIFRSKAMVNELEEYIIQTTQPADTVLTWHIHLGINFITDRDAPSKYLFPLNLFIPPNENNTKLKEYVDELEARPPELIVVQKVSSLALPFVDKPLDQLCSTYCTPEFTQALEIPQIQQQWRRFRQFFLDHYSLDNSIYDWNVYRKLP